MRYLVQIVFAGANLLVTTVLLLSVLLLTAATLRLRDTIATYVQACRDLGEMPYPLDPPPAIAVGSLMLMAAVAGVLFGLALP